MSRNRYERSAVPPPPAFVYWVTRERDYANGHLQDYVLLWHERPIRQKVGDLGVEWRCDNARGGLVGLTCSIWPGDCFRLVGAVPDSDLEMIRVERNTMLICDPRRPKDVAVGAPPPKAQRAPR